LLLVVFIYFFSVYDINFYGPDDAIYFAYISSVAEDGDLNAADDIGQRYPYYLDSGKIGVSGTYNLPDFHNHGGVVLWVPFYAYAKFMYQAASKFKVSSLSSGGLSRIIRCALSFSTVIFGFCAVILTYFLCRVFFNKSNSLLSIAAITLGTPYLYFMLAEPGNANILASLLSVVSILFCCYLVNGRKSDWFLYGLFFSICIAVKLDLWFQLIFIGLFFSVLILLKQVPPRNILYFILGILPGAALIFINNYIKYGTFHIGELGVLNLRESYFFEQLFSSYRGIFYTSPILYLCFLESIFIIADLVKNKINVAGGRFDNRDREIGTDLFFIILVFYVLIKIFVMSKNYAWGGGTTSGRLLLTEFPVFVLLFSRLLEIKKRRLRYAIIIAVIPFIAWNLLVLSEYMTGADFKYIVRMPPLNMRIPIIKSAFYALFYPKELYIKIQSCFPLLIIVLAGIFYLVSILSRNRPLFFARHKAMMTRLPMPLVIFTVCLFTGYAAVTSSNIINNSRNVRLLKKDGFLEKTKIIAPYEFEKEENIGSMEAMIEYFRLKKDFGRAERIQRSKEKIYGDKT